MILLYLLFFILLAATLGVLLWPIRSQKQSVAIIGACFFIGAFGLYAFVGSPHIVPLLEVRAEKIAEVKQSMEKNSAIVKANPKNLSAWVELGQAFVETGQLSAAANAFKQAVILSKGDPQLIMAYAKALILSEDGKVSDLAQKSLQMVVLQEPKHEEARYWIAVRQLQDGHTEEAMKSMKELYRSLPADSPVKAMIDRQIH